MRLRTPDLFSVRIESVCLRPERMFPAASRSSRLRISLVSTIAQPTMFRAASPGAIIG